MKTQLFYGKHNVIARTALCFAVFINCYTVLAQYKSLRTEQKWWQPVDGEVRTIAIDSIRNHIYLGGTFTGLGIYNPFGAIADTSEGNIEPLRFPRPDSYISCLISDGKGGYFAGGNFTKIGDSIRNRIAHIDSNGRVSSLFNNGKGFNSIVNTLYLKDKTLYAGGWFTSYDHPFNWKKFGFVCNMNTGKPKKVFPSANDIINTSVSDGNGGWFIGGNFTALGDSARKYFAHISADGGVTAWNPAINGPVNSLYLDGNNLYIGGNFTKIDTFSRSNAASINIKSKRVSNWKPDPNGMVRVILVSKVSNRVYLAGLFTGIGGSAYKILASTDTVIGKAIPWNPNPNTDVYALELHNNKLYAGGRFSSIGGALRNNIAALDTSSGVADPWYPIIGGSVYSIKAGKSQIFIGGDFSNVNGQSRKGIVSLTIDSAKLNSWNPGYDGEVRSLCFFNKNIFVGGRYWTIDNQASSNLGLLDTSSGEIQELEIFTNNRVLTISGNDSDFFFGGEFTSSGSNKRIRLASINTDNGELNSWNPASNGVVMTITGDDSSVYAGGSFNYINKLQRNGLVKIHRNKNEIYGWDAKTSSGSQINTLELYRGRLYVGGSFTNIGNQSRNNIALLDTNTGNALNWNPNANSSVYVIRCDKDRVYAGGNFFQIGGYSTKGLAALDTLSGNAVAWYPGLNGTVSSMLLSDGYLYIGGSFTSAGGQNRNNLAKLDLISAKARLWNPDPNLSVGIVAKFGNKIFAGGGFTSFKTISRKYLAVLDALSGEPLGYNLNPGGAVNAVFVGRDKIYVGGDFYFIGGKSRNNVAAFDPVSGIVNSWNPGANAAVLSITENGNKVYLGGIFNTVNGKVRNYAASTDTVLGTVNNWNPNPNSTVYSIKNIASSIYLGGAFTTVSGIQRRCLAKVDTVSGAPTAWNPEANGLVLSMQPKNGYLMVCGGFSKIGSYESGALATIDTGTGIPLPLKANVNSFVYGMQEYKNDLYIAGSFSSVDFQARKGIAALNPGFRVRKWNINPDQYGLCITGALGKLFIGGNFTFPGSRFAVLSEPMPRLVVTGNNIIIKDRDESPGSTDGTAFGKVIRNSSRISEFILRNEGDDTLFIDRTTVLGTDSVYFSLLKDLTSSYILPGDSVNLNIAFKPLDSGLRKARIAILNNDPESADFYFTVSGSSEMTCDSNNQIPYQPGYYRSKYINVRSSANTCYCDSNYLLLLSLNLKGTNAVVPDTSVSLMISTPIAEHYSQGRGFVSNPSGFTMWNRTWEVEAATQPTSMVKVRYYFDSAMVDSINFNLISRSQQAMPSMDSMYFYKVINSSKGAHPPVDSLTAADIRLIRHNTYVSDSTWIRGYSGISNIFAEFGVTSFSGGGGGGGNGGRSPLPIAYAELMGKVIIYPNPAADFLYISANVNYSDLILSVRSTDGKEILKPVQFTLSQKPVIDIRSLDSGVYIVCIQIDGNLIHKKLIIE